MADYHVRRRTLEHVEYVLPLPTDYIEVEKMMAGIRQNLAGDRPDFPYIEVTATDTEMIFFYKVTEEIVAI
jgi:hypothetical protein